jgi:soluble cytochrome b562
MVKAVSYKKNKARATNKKAKVAKKGRTMKKSGGMRKSAGMKKRTASKKSGGMRKSAGMKKQRGGNADLVEKINDELRREMENGNISSAFFQCLTMNNEAGKMVRKKAAKWGNLTVSEWTTRVIMDNENCQIHLD